MASLDRLSVPRQGACFAAMESPRCMQQRHASISQLVSAAYPLHRQRSIRRLQRHQLNASQRARQCIALASTSPSLQLATAKLPKETNPDAFVKAMFDWASTMTSSGRNLPFSLPIRTRQKERGIEISLLRVNNNKQLISVGDILAKVEEEPQVGNILYVRFFEGEGAQSLRSTPLPENTQERLRTIVDGLVDVPLIMGSMKNAIRQAVQLSK